MTRNASHETQYAKRLSPMVRHGCFAIRDPSVGIRSAFHVLRVRGHVASHGVREVPTLQHTAVYGHVVQRYALYRSATPTPPPLPLGRQRLGGWGDPSLRCDTVKSLR